MCVNFLTDIFFADFALGILSFYILRKLNGLFSDMKLSLLFAFCAYGGMVILICFDIRKPVAALLSITVFICFVLAYKGRKIPMLLIKFGDISYSFYLIHYYVIIAVTLLLPMDNFDLVFVFGILIIFVMSCILGYVCYLIAERWFVSVVYKMLDTIKIRSS